MLNLLSTIPAGRHEAIARFVAPMAGLLAIIGALVALLGFLGEETGGESEGEPLPLGARLFMIVGGLGLVAIAVFCVIVSLYLLTVQGRFKKYVAILTGVESMSIQKVAEFTGSSPTRARTEIQTMIDSEMITDFYIDYGADQVISKKYIPKTSHKTVVKCSECGGNNDLIVGITKYCSFCGQPLLLGAT